MGDFNPAAGVFLVSALSLCISFYFFLKAMLMNANAWREGKSHDPKIWGPVGWGFAFQILGFLGLHYLGQGVPPQ